MISVTYPKEIIKDKIRACWIGKNIGGTIGGPYEGRQEMLDIDGFSSAKGEPLPNDDLDLQIAWFLALKRCGAKNFDSNTLADAWQLFIAPNWNEYGISKKNLNLGLLPPLSGEFENEKWKHSNGAWIRSEIWACLAAGFPNVAIKYAIFDASIDHGMCEGTYAEIFTAALESIAFVKTDIREIIETALTFIPKECRVAECVRLVLGEYQKKTPYRDVRNMLVETTADLGWFQAPANLGYVVLGLLYGEGDFKKSIIYAVNCGDDTDCTAGTVGAFLGILYGTSGIPEDWREYIGDSIKQICINGHYHRSIPKTCTEFTDWILDMIPDVLEENGVSASFGEGLDYNYEEALGICQGCSEKFFNRNAYSFEVCQPLRLSAVVEYESEPVVKLEKPFNIKITFNYLSFDEVMRFKVDMLLPDGWTADYKRSLSVHRDYDKLKKAEDRSCTFTVTPSAGLSAQNKLFIILSSPNFAIPFTIPITLIG